MKNLLFFTAFICISGTAFAQTSEFERGYIAGTKTCTIAQEAWICTLPQNDCMNRYVDPQGNGRSEAEAKLRLPKDCVIEAMANGIKPSCTKL